MAFFTQDMDAGGETNPPISAHPAFPAIVAAWFALLLGLGSLVLPSVLFERAVSASGLPSLIVATNPPLGFTARVLIALCAAAGGAIAGLLIARRVTGPRFTDHESEPGESFAVAPPAPVSVHEEIGGAGVINGRGLPVTNGRALAIADDDGPEDHLYVAPIVTAPAKTASPDREQIRDTHADGEPLSFRPPSMTREQASAAHSSAPAAAPREARAEIDENADLHELVHRLGDSLMRRRALRAGVIGADQSPPQPRAAALEVAPAEEAARAMAEFFGQAAPVQAVDPADARGRRPFDPPPGADSTPAVSAETENALRAALATLREASAGGR